MLTQINDKFIQIFMSHLSIHNSIANVNLIAFQTYYVVISAAELELQFARKFKRYVRKYTIQFQRRENFLF